MSDEEPVIVNDVQLVPPAEQVITNGHRRPDGKFAKGHQFGYKKGQSGTHGRTRSETLGKAARRQLKKIVPGVRRQTYAEAIAESLAKAAIAGDVTAARELTDRAEGKARQPLEHSGGFEIGHYNSWADLSAHCEYLGIDPEFAREQVMLLIESADDE